MNLLEMMTKRRLDGDENGNEDEGYVRWKSRREFVVRMRV